MSDHPVLRRAADLGAVDGVLCRLCETDDEVAAMKRVLGVSAEEDRITDAFTPERPPLPEFRPQVDNLARAHASVARYAAWINSHPDTDPTPLRDRERTLQLAQLDLQRLSEEA